MPCLDENTVVEFIQGLLSPEAVTRIEEHVDACPSCRLLLGEVAKLSVVASSKRYAVAEDIAALEEDDTPLENPCASKEHLPLPGQVLAGRFRIIEQLGCGSFGTVYEAEDLQLQERVALKLLRPEVRDAPSLLKHLHHEIVVGRRISHPNVCRMYDLGTWGDIHFISMALVQGESLDVLLAKKVPSHEQAEEILLQICGALEAAHEQGVVHRDLKPSNIMVDAEGKVTVMDFGLARDLRAGPSRSGMLIGSPAYWSPEQAQGERATERSDIYTLGLLACDLLGVKRPSFGGSLVLTGAQAAYRPVLERCLKPNPEDRFASAREVREAVLRSRRRARPGLRPRLVIMGAAGLVVSGGIAVLLLWPRSPSAPPFAHVASVSPRLLVEPAQTPSTAPPSVATERDRAGLRTAEDEPSIGRSDHRKPKKKGGHPRRKGSSEDALVAKAKSAKATIEKKPEGKRPATAQWAQLKEALSRIEGERRKRKILLEDAPTYRALLKEAQQALEKESEGAKAILARLEETLRQQKIDGAFISRKLERLNRLKGSLRIDEATSKKVTEIFAKVHDRYFSGDYEAANEHLNQIWRVLGKRE
jgi:hypothetical protein